MKISPIWVKNRFLRDSREIFKIMEIVVEQDFKIYNWNVQSQK